MKIGVGIITCGRKEMFDKLFNSLLICKDQIDQLFIIEDTRKPNPDFENYIIESTQDKWKGDNSLVRITTDVNLGVAKSKNYALQHLLNKGCDHIFLIEDDMLIKDSNVFQSYINASKKSGIQHFNFSQHGFANKIRNNVGEIISNPKITVRYDNIGISFYQHCVGSFSYYSRKCLEEVGLMDERYYNACEHVDHTYEIIKKGYHSPFWWFADIENSWEYIGDDGWSIETSSICSNPSFTENVKKADNIFLEKHGHVPTQTPISSEEQFLKSLKHLRQTWT
jgi:GT2 family glycosyltransferase